MDKLDLIYDIVKGTKHDVEKIGHVLDRHESRIRVLESKRRFRTEGNSNRWLDLLDTVMEYPKLWHLLLTGGGILLFFWGKTHVWLDKVEAAIDQPESHVEHRQHRVQSDE